MSEIKKFIEENSVGEDFLQDWYINSVCNEVTPVWTDEHIAEVCEDFYLIPKEVVWKTSITEESGNKKYKVTYYISDFSLNKVVEGEPTFTRAGSSEEAVERIIKDLAHLELTLHGNEIRIKNSNKLEVYRDGEIKNIYFSFIAHKIDEWRGVFTEQDNEFLKITGTKCEIVYLGKECIPFYIEKSPRNKYLCIFTRKGTTRKFIYWDYITKSEGDELGVDPSVVLRHLWKYDCGSFKDFSNKHGEGCGWYYRGGIKQMYKLCCEEYDKVLALWGDVIGELRALD